MPLPRPASRRLHPGRLLPRALVLALGGAALAYAPMAAGAVAPVAGGQSAGDSLFAGIGNTGYDVSHYDLDIAWTPPLIPGSNGGSIVATATIDATTTDAPLSSYSFDLEGLTVSAVTVDGAPATFTRVEDASITKHKLVVTPAEAVDGDFTTVVTYSGSPVSHTDPDGSSEGWGATPDGVIFLNQPVGAMTGFPNNNTPRDKATYDVSLDIPSTINLGASAAVSNGELESRTVSGARTTWRWVQQEQQATMAMIISIGRYNMTARDITLASGRVLPEWTFIDPNATGAAGAATAATNLKAYIDFFETEYGPYPGNSTGIVVDQILPTNNINYALETQDRSFFPNSVGTSTNIHEAMHQWWGDGVSPVEWNDIWISEGAASYSEVQYPNESTPQTSTTTTETANFNLWNSTAASSANWTIPPADMGDPANLFRWQTYNRSEMVYAALETAIGTAAYDEFMLEYQQRFNGQSPGTAAFIDLAEEISGYDLTAFFQDWIYDPDKPAWPGKFDLGVTSNPAGGPVSPGEAIDHTVSVVNTGRVVLTGAVVAIDVADLVDDADLGTLPAGTTLEGTTLTWNVPDTALATTSAITIPATVKDDTTSGNLGVDARAVTLGGTCVGCTSDVTAGLDAISPAPTPTITGTPQVGQTLTAVAGAWDPQATLSYQWTRDGEPIPGATATTYLVQPGDLGAVIRVAVTGIRSGFADTTRVSAPTEAVVAGEPGEQTLSPEPEVAGKARVGKRVRAVLGTYDAGSTQSLQWLAGGKPIAGATGSTYRPQAGDVGKRLAVRVTSTKPGTPDLVATSDPTVPVSKGKFAKAPTPKVAGTPEVGRTLKAKPGQWAGGVTLKYRWFVGGTKVAGVTGRRLDLTPAMRGKRVWVVVVGKRPGYLKQKATSLKVGPVTA